MGKVFSCILLSIAALMSNGCAPVQRSFPASPEASEPGVYRLSTQASSRKVIAETVRSAHEQCSQEDKHYLFVRNIFRRGTYTLYFTCVEEGDPRLKERKPQRKPLREKAEPREPEPEKAKPSVQEQPPPSKEPAEEKPSLPKEETKAPQEEKPPLSEKELLRQLKKNPGPGELEELRQEDSSPDIEEELDAIIIEESLGGTPLDMENYLKNRRKKKKTR